MTTPSTPSFADLNVHSAILHATQVVVCAEEAKAGRAVAAVRGRCPVHDGDACLYVFVHAREAIDNVRRLR